MTYRTEQICDSNIIIYEEFTFYAQTKHRGLDFVWETGWRQHVRKKNESGNLGWGVWEAALPIKDSPERGEGVQGEGAWHRPAPGGTGKVPSLGGEADMGLREEKDQGMPGHWHRRVLCCRFQHEVMFVGSVFPLPKKMTVSPKEPDAEAAGKVACTGGPRYDGRERGNCE